MTASDPVGLSNFVVGFVSSRQHGGLGIGIPSVRERVAGHALASRSLPWMVVPFVVGGRPTDIAGDRLELLDGLRPFRWTFRVWNLQGYPGPRGAEIRGGVRSGRGGRRVFAVGRQRAAG